MQILVFLFIECFSYLVGIFHGALANQLPTTDITERGCVYNMQLRDGNCTTCPPGWFGAGCGEPCPYGYYGTLCKEKCDCNERVEICKDDVGCTSITTEGGEKSPIYITVAVTVTIMLCILTVSAVYIRVTKTTPALREQLGQRSSSAHQNIYANDGPSESEQINNQDEQTLYSQPIKNQPRLPGDDRPINSQNLPSRDNQRNDAHLSYPLQSRDVSPSPSDIYSKVCKSAVYSYLALKQQYKCDDENNYYDV